MLRLAMAKQSWVQDRETGELVPKGEYVRESRGPMIMKDIEPFQSMIDGRLITSRSRMREHYRENRVIEIGNERITPKPYSPAPGLREAIINAVRRK